VLAFLLISRAHAAVVETAVAPAPTPVGGPAVSVGVAPIPTLGAVAPLSSGLSLSPSALGAILAAPASIGVVRLAPAVVPALPASAVPTAAAAAQAPADPLAPAPAAVAAEALPPPAPAVAVAAAAAMAALPSGPAGVAARVASARAALAAPPSALRAGAPAAEDSAAAGRVVWDLAGALAGLSAGPASAPVRSGGGVAALGEAAGPAAAGTAAGSILDGGQTLRDAVSGVAGSGLRPAEPGALAAASARPGAVFAFGGTRAGVAPALAVPAAFAAPSAIERLTLSLGADLVVRVRGALGLDPRTVIAAAIPAPRPAAALARPLPPFSTEWLERRALLETAAYVPGALDVLPSDAGVSVAAAAGAARPARTSAAPDARAAGRREAGTLAPEAAFLGWWVLAFLPATLALLRESLSRPR
jgi:hypothetical protein